MIVCQLFIILIKVWVTYKALLLMWKRINKMPTGLLKDHFFDWSRCDVIIVKTYAIFCKKPLKFRLHKNFKDVLCLSVIFCPLELKFWPRPLTHIAFRQCFNQIQRFTLHLPLHQHLHSSHVLGCENLFPLAMRGKQ